jgi:hypothetical protein
VLVGFAPPLVVESLLFFPGLWIRIDSIRIRIKLFSSIRIWNHKIIESGSNADTDPHRTSEDKNWFQMFKILIQSQKYYKIVLFCTFKL